MNEEIKGVLESLSWTLGSGQCSVGIQGQPRDFRGNQRQVQNFLTEERVTVGDSVTITVDSIGMMMRIRLNFRCPRCKSEEVETEQNDYCAHAVCAACGHSGTIAEFKEVN